MRAGQLDCQFECPGPPASLSSVVSFSFMPAITEIELECVGNAVNIKALCAITWFETLDNESTKRAAIIEHFLPIKSLRRQSRVNYLRFEIQEGKFYHYRRYVRVKPPTWEEKWFKFENSQVIALDQGQGDQTPNRFLEPIRKAWAERGIFNIFGGQDRLLALEYISATEDSARPQGKT